MRNKQKLNSNFVTIIPIIVAIIGCIGAIVAGSSSELVKALLNPSPVETSPAGEAVIKFVVLDKSSNKSISGATITLQIDVMPSETNVTDTDGVARFFLKPESIGLHGFLQIEAGGYKSQKKDIDIDEKKPIVIYLEAENTLAPQPTSASQSEDSDGNIEKFISDYYELLNKRDYQLAYLMTTERFKKKRPYADYTSYWDTVEKTEIMLINVKSSSGSETYVYAEIRYFYKNGAITTGHSTYTLVKYGKSWLFDS